MRSTTLILFLAAVVTLSTTARADRHRQRRATLSGTTDGQPRADVPDPVPEPAEDTTPGPRVSEEWNLAAVAGTLDDADREPAPRKEHDLGLTDSDQVAAIDEPRPAEPPPAVDKLVVPPPPKELHPTPRFTVAGGFFLQSRGLDFDYDPYADSGPPSYPETGVKGFAASAAVYPLPIQKYDGKLSGVGFSFAVAKSVGSSIVAEDEYEIGEYEVDHTAYDIGVHYRYPIDHFAIDGAVSYGNWSHAIIDLPETIEIPDTSYTYLSAGAHVDVYPTERASIGVGLKYLHVMSSGDVEAEDWYGAGWAKGVALDGGVSIPLPMNLFVHAGVEWRKIWLDFDGSGWLSDYWGVGTMYDEAITGSAELGVEF